MRRLQFALIALVATAVGASVCASPILAAKPPKKSSKKSMTRKKVTSSRSRRDRKGCPPRRSRTKRPPRGIQPTPPRGTTTRIIEREVVKKVELSQETLDKLKQEIIDSIKFPDIPKPDPVDLTAIIARLDAQQKMLQMLIECCEQYKKDRTFDLRKTAHFEEQLCDILTIVKQQQECLDKLCKQMGTSTTMGSGPTRNVTTRTASEPVQMKPARLSVSRDIDGDIFDGSDFRVQTGYDLGKFPLFGGNNSALQLYADHFEVGTPTSGAGLAGRFYAGKTGRINLYGGAGVGVYTTNFAQGGAHQTETGGKVFVGLETNRRSFVEFNVTSIQNYGSNSRRANVYFGQRF
jgi:hypothetical protein